MKRLQKCCCCASTRTGTLIVATLGIILSIATIIAIWVAPRHTVAFSTFIFDKDFDKKLSDNENRFINTTLVSSRTGTLILVALGIILSIATIIATVAFSTFIFDKDIDKKLSDHEIPRIILTINLIFTILICTLLIVAVKKRRSWMMLPFVVLGIVLAIGLLISILHTSITYYLDDGDYVILATCVLVGGLIYLCIYLYLWVVVFSHYLDVRDEEERGRYRKAPYRR